MTSIYLLSLVSAGILFLSPASSQLRRRGGTSRTGRPRAPLSSRLFWTPALTVFGLSGLGLDNLGFGLALSPCECSVPLIAIAIALVVGLLAVLLFGRAATDETNIAADERDYVGKVGRVLVEISSEHTGKVRVNLRSSSVDVLARTDETEPFAVGDEALIINMSDTTAVVIRPANDPDQE